MEYELTLGGRQKHIKEALQNKLLGILIKPTIPFPLRKKGKQYYVSFDLKFPIYINIKNLETKKQLQYQFVYSMDYHCFGIDVNQGNGFSELYEKDFDYQPIINFIREVIRSYFSFNDLITFLPHFKHNVPLFDIYNKRKDFLKKILKKQINGEPIRLTVEERKEKEIIFNKMGAFKVAPYPSANQDWLVMRGWYSFIYFAYPDEAKEYFMNKQEKHPWISFPAIEFQKYNRIIQRINSVKTKKINIDQQNELIDF